MIAIDPEATDEPGETRVEDIREVVADRDADRKGPARWRHLGQLELVAVDVEQEAMRPVIDQRVLRRERIGRRSDGPATVAAGGVAGGEC